MKKPLRIFVVEPANGGGLIHFSYQLCNALSKAGADVILIVGRDYELDSLPHLFKVKKILNLWNSFEDRANTLNFGLFRRGLINLFRNLRRVVRGVRFFFNLVMLANLLIRLRPDWILFSSIQNPLHSLFISFLKFNGLALSQICHEFEEREKTSLIARLLYQMNEFAYGSFSKIFFLSDDSQNRFLSLFSFIDKSSTFSIPHGNSDWLLGIQSSVESVNLHERYAIKNNEPVVVFFGLLSPSKGVDDLIVAFSILEKSQNAKLVIAGYPTKYIEPSTLKTLVDNLGLADKVVLDLRYVPLNEIGALMDLATVVVYPYHSSTQSGALQTAYTFGKPVIATKVGGLPEVVEDGKSGFLVSAHAPHELAEKILIMLKNPAQSIEMGQYARMLSNTKFNWDIVAEKILTAYNH